MFVCIVVIVALFALASMKLYRKPWKKVRPGHFANRLRGSLAYQTKLLNKSLDLALFTDVSDLFERHIDLVERTEKLVRYLNVAVASGQANHAFFSLADSIMENQRLCEENFSTYRNLAELTPYSVIKKRMNGCFFCSSDLQNESLCTKTSLHGVEVRVPACSGCLQQNREGKRPSMLVYRENDAVQHWSLGVLTKNRANS